MLAVGTDELLLDTLLSALPPGPRTRLRLGPAGNPLLGACGLLACLHGGKLGISGELARHLPCARRSRLPGRNLDSRQGPGRARCCAAPGRDATLLPAWVCLRLPASSRATVPTSVSLTPPHSRRASNLQPHQPSGDTKVLPREPLLWETAEHRTHRDPRGSRHSHCTLGKEGDGGSCQAMPGPNERAMITGCRSAHSHPEGWSTSPEGSDQVLCPGRGVLGSPSCPRQLLRTARLVC